MIHVEVQMARMTKIHGVPSAHFLMYCIPRYIIALSTQVELYAACEDACFNVACFIPPSSQKQFPINLTLLLSWYRGTAIFCCVNDKNTAAKRTLFMIKLYHGTFHSAEIFIFQFGEKQSLTLRTTKELDISSFGDKRFELRRETILNVE